MNILIAHNYYAYAGGEDSVFRNEVGMLRERGHNVFVFTRNNKDINKFPSWKKIFVPFNNVFSIKNYFQIRKLIRSKHIDVVHVHNTLPLIGSAIYYAAVAEKVPIVQTVHNYRLICPGGVMYRNGRIDYDCLNRGLGYSVLHRCYRHSMIQTLAVAMGIKINRILGIYKRVHFIFLTQSSKLLTMQLNDKYHRTIIDPNKSYIKPNFSPATVSEATGLCEISGFAFVGRLEEMKGIVTLLESWKKGGATMPTLTICGDGPLLGWCRDFVETNQLTNVRLMGKVKQEVVKNILKTSEAIIVPSKWLEGMPMVILEALSVGTPIIGSDIGNVNDLILEGVTGTHFRGNSAIDLLHVVQKFDSRKFSRSLIQAYFESNYAKNQNYNKLLSIYQHMIRVNSKERILERKG